MTFFRSREQRMADRHWCDQFQDFDEVEDLGHGVLTAVTIGIAIYLAVAAVFGWLA